MSGVLCKAGVHPLHQASGLAWRAFGSGTYTSGTPPWSFVPGHVPRIHSRFHDVLPQSILYQCNMYCSKMRNVAAIETKDGGQVLDRGTTMLRERSADIKVAGAGVGHQSLMCALHPLDSPL